MKICSKFQFGDVEAYEFGYGFIVRPPMTVFLYCIDGILVDTAQPLMRKAVVDVLQNKRISRIVLTHHHEDHSGNAAILKELKKASVYADRRAREKMRDGFRILPYQHVLWGRPGMLDVLPLDGKIEGINYTLTPVHTPGHSEDHTVFFEEHQGWLFSGDLYLSDRIKYFRSDEKFGDTVRSLRKVLELDFEALFCAHSPSPTNGKEMIRRKLHFLEDILGEVKTLLEKGYEKKEIVMKMSREEVTFVKLATLGDVSLARMISSAIDFVIS